MTSLFSPVGRRYDGGDAARAVRVGRSSRPRARPPNPPRPSSAVAALAEWLADAPDAVVLHVGDADGQGLAIEADIGSRLALHAVRLGANVPTVERMWLSVEQAQAHGLPSRPAKLTPMDRKYGFVAECWEAEAGDPAIIAGLVRARAGELLDGDVLAEVAERERAARAAFAELAHQLEAA